MKQCSKCTQYFDKTNFYKSKKNKDGLKTECKKCHKLYNKKYREKNKEKFNSNQRKRRQRKKENKICQRCPAKTIENSIFCEKHFFYDLSKRNFNTIEYCEQLKQIAEKQNYICPYSGQRLVPGINISMDHILPKSRFPEFKNNIDNIQFCDINVNNAKFDMTEKEFIKFIERIYYYVKRNKMSESLCMPLSDIIDRFTIFKLKAERLPENDMSSELLGVYQSAIEGELRGKSKRFRKKIKQLTSDLYEANKSIWNLEADIRNGKLDEKRNLKEIGQRAILIRENNKKRINIKNKISNIAGQLHGLDKKINHGSE